MEAEYRRWADIPLYRALKDLRALKGVRSSVVSGYVEALDLLVESLKEEVDELRKRVPSAVGKGLLEVLEDEKIFRVVIRGIPIRLLMIKNLSDVFITSREVVVNISEKMDFFYVAQMNLLPAFCVTTGFPVDWRFWGSIGGIYDATKAFDLLEFDTSRCDVSCLNAILSRDRNPYLSKISMNNNLRDLIVKHLKVSPFLLPPDDLYSPGIFPLFLHDKYEIKSVLSIFRTVIRVKKDDDRVPHIIPDRLKRRYKALGVDYLTLTGQRTGKVFVSKDYLHGDLKVGGIYDVLVVTVLSREGSRVYIMPQIIAAQPEIGGACEDVEVFEAVRDLVVAEMGRSYISNGDYLFYVGLTKKELAKRAKERLQRSFLRILFRKGSSKDARSISRSMTFSEIVDLVLGMYKPIIQERHGRVYYVHLPFISEKLLTREEPEWLAKIGNRSSQKDILSIMRREMMLEYSVDKQDALSAVGLLLLSAKDILRRYLKTRGGRVGGS